MWLSELRGRDRAALAIAAVLAVVGLGTWVASPVDLGLRLGTSEDGVVRVTEVLPESIAAANYISVGSIVVFLERVGGEPVPTRESSFGDALTEDPNDRASLPAEALPEPEIQFVSIGWTDEVTGELYAEPEFGVYRFDWLARLSGGGLLLLLGAGLGFAGAAAVERGFMGAQWSSERIPLGVALAAPLMALPLVYTGSPVGIGAGYGLAALAAMPAAGSLASRFPDPAWRRSITAASVVVGALAVLLTVRVLLGAGGTQGGSQGGGDRWLLLGGITVIPALVTGLSGSRQLDERLRIIVLGGLPAVAMGVLASFYPSPWLLFVALGAAVAWRTVPWADLRARLPTVDARPEPASVRVAPPPRVAGESRETVARRDTATVAVAGVTAVLALLGCCDTWALIIGAGLGGAAAFALGRGFLGPAWVDAAIPIGVAIAVPIMLLASPASGSFYDYARILMPALAALPVAHLLANRHPDPAARRSLFVGSLALAALAVVLFGAVLPRVSDGGGLEGYLVMGLIALVPGLASSLATGPGGATRSTDRLDLLAIAITPGAAMTLLVPYSPNPLPLVVWIIAVIAWRRLTIAPLLGLATRTQRQRDLAVAAAEAERARLAADLHDDALQELSALVRRLDAAGDAEGAELARGVAERLRAITSDLRLPLLDDLGAGPALEWLVGRVRPLADGEVRLERVDPHRPPPGVELAVFRVAQEALANAVKHGKPPITVRYRVDEAGGVSLSVDDEGPGIDATAAEEALHAGHLGVANMQQRAEQIGALLDIRRWPSGGTHVALEWRPR